MKICSLGLSAIFLLLVSPQTHAVETIQILSNTEYQTKLYEKPDFGSKVSGEFSANEKFEPAIAVLEKKDGFIQFERLGVKSWVLLRNVNTNRQIRMEETCGAMPVEKFKKNVASTRGVGEPCKK